MNRWKKTISIQRIEPYVYLLPALLSILYWVYRPLIQTFELSFYQWNLLPTSPKVFVALDNYMRIFSLPDLQLAIWNTFIYMVGLWPMSLLIPLLVAILTDQTTRQYSHTYRALIFIPMIMAPVVVASVWRWILHPTNGILNATLSNMWDLETPIRFFSDIDLAIYSIIFITGWKIMGFSMLVFATGLTGINREYYEAAAIDGARRSQVIWKITLPLLSPYILFILMISTLFSAEWSFIYINVLTQGGPLQSTTNIYYILYHYGFQTYSIGWSSSAATLFFIFFGLIAYGFVKLSQRFSFYDNE
jgi:multiple sugar transport system permease protein